MPRKSAQSGGPGYQTAPLADRRRYEDRPEPSMPKTQIQREPWPVFQARMKGDQRD